jgi:hypothetical protein
MNKYNKYMIQWSMDYSNGTKVPYVNVNARISRKGWFNDKLTKVFRDLRKLGFYAKKNSACCSGCTIVPEAQEESGKYTFITDQDMYEIRDGYQKFVYLPFGDETAAWQIIAMCQKHDLNAIWNGDVGTRILVANYDMNEDFLKLWKKEERRKYGKVDMQEYKLMKKQYERGTLKRGFRLFADKDGYFEDLKDEHGNDLHIASIKNFKGFRYSEKGEAVLHFTGLDITEFNPIRNMLGSYGSLKPDAVKDLFEYGYDHKYNQTAFSEPQTALYLKLDEKKLKYWS